MPRHQSESMGQLPPKKPNIDEEKPINFFDANCLQKDEICEIWRKKTIWQPWLRSL